MKLSVMHVGFGGAILAGLLLAFIGHPGPTTLPIAASTAAASASPNAPRTFVLKSVSVELPSSDVAFPGRMPRPSPTTVLPVIPPAWC